MEESQKPQEPIKRETRPDDINAVDSSKKGVSGLIENFFRKFKELGFLILLFPISVLYVICIGTALTPGILVIMKIASWLTLHPQNLLISSLCYGLGLGITFVGFTLTIVFIVPIANLPFIPFVKAYRGPWFSIESIPWYYHNALTYLVRYSVLEFLTPSPLNILFFKMMGMKIGKGVMINTTNISDPCLLILDDYVTIGGSAYLMAHYGMKGFLIIDKLHIKKGAMIGLGAKLLGGVTIGEKATVLPNSAILPKTIVKDGEKFGVSSGSIS